MGTRRSAKFLGRAVGIVTFQALIYHQSQAELISITSEDGAQAARRSSSARSKRLPGWRCTRSASGRCAPSLGKTVLPALHVDPVQRLSPEQHGGVDQIHRDCRSEQRNVLETWERAVHAARFLGLDPGIAGSNMRLRTGKRHASASITC